MIVYSLVYISWVSVYAGYICISRYPNVIFFGDASEHIITTLTNIEGARVYVEMDGIIAHLIS
jgi:hypothetical protein